MVGFQQLSGCGVGAYRQDGQNWTASVFTEALPPGFPSDHLSIIEVGKNYLRGTPIRAVGLEWKQTANGLIVPARIVQLQSPIDRILVYLTPQEVFGFSPPEFYLRSAVERLTAEQVVIEAASIFAEFRQPGVRRAQVDRKFAERWFVGTTRHRVLNLLRDDRRGLIVPQALLALVQYAMHCSGDSLLPAVDRGNFVAALIVMSDQLGLSSGIPEESVVTQVPGMLGRELISNQIFNSEMDEVNLVCRFFRTWLQLPKERSSSGDIEDLEEAYEDALGVPLRDVLAIGLSLWASVLNSTPVVTLDYLAGLHWPLRRIENALAVFSATLPEFRSEVRTEASKSSTDWSFGTFSRYPVIRLWDDRMVVLDLKLLVERLFSWLPFFDLEFALLSRGKSGRKRSARLKQCLGKLSEVYVSEVLDSLFGSTSEWRRVYHDEHLKRAYSGYKVKIADAAIDYGTSWVIVEVTTTKLKRDSVYGVSDKSVVEDLEKLVEEVAQIDSTIKQIRENEERLTGHPASVSKRYYPLLVTTEGFPVNPISLTLLRERVDRRGLLADPDVEPLEVIDVAELEIIESLVEQGGPGLVEVLDGKKEAGLWRSSIRDYILIELNRKPTRSARISRLFDEVSADLMQRLFPGVKLNSSYDS